MPNTFYHVTPVYHYMGRILLPASELGIQPVWAEDSDPEWVYLSSHWPHRTIAWKAIRDNWHIYEVRPMEKVFPGLYPGEYLVKRAKVVKYLGRAGRLARKRGNNEYYIDSRNYDERQAQVHHEFIESARKYESFARLRELRGEPDPLKRKILSKRAQRKARRRARRKYLESLKDSDCKGGSE